MRLRITVITVVAVLVGPSGLLLGCGQSDEEKAEETAVAHFKAIGDGDYEEGC